MFTISDFIPNVRLSSQQRDLIEYQLAENTLLQKPENDRFAILGIYLPDDSVIKPPPIDSDKAKYDFKYEFAVSVSNEICQRVAMLTASSFKAKFPLMTPTQANPSGGKLIFKLSNKCKPDISMVTETDDFMSIDPSKLLPGSLVLVEGIVKPYSIPNSQTAGTVIELVSMCCLATTEMALVPSPTKRKIQEFLENRKRANSTD